MRTLTNLIIISLAILSIHCGGNLFNSGTNFPPILKELVIEDIDSDYINLQKPVLSMVGNPTPTVNAYIGINGTISVSGSTVSNYTQGPIDVYTSGYQFNGLIPDTDYRIIVVAQNPEGYSVKQIVITFWGPPALNNLIIESIDSKTVTLQQPTLAIACYPFPSVNAYIGYDGNISVSGSTVNNYIQGPINVSTISYQFNGLNENTAYRIIVIAQNSEGYSVKQIVATTWGPPDLNNLVIEIFDPNSITLQQPTFAVACNPAPTVNAYIGYDGTITVNGSSVSNYTQGPIDVSTSGYQFSGLNSNTTYRIIVVAQNLVGYSVDQIVQNTSAIAPVLNNLVIDGFDTNSITLQKPTFSVAGNPAPTVNAYIGLDGTISVSGSTVSNYIQGPIDVSTSGYQFNGLNEDTAYRIFVVAQNSEGYDVKEIPQTTDVTMLSEWIQKASMPTARINHRVVELNGYLYAIGGQYYNSVVERYDPSSDTWGTMADMNSNRECFAIGVIDGRIYVSGGFFWTSPSGGGEGNSTEEYNPSTNTWVYKASMPTTRSGPAYGVIDGKLYVAGGETPGNGTTTVLEIYDPDSWSSGTSLPVPRRHGYSAVANGKLYLFDGGDGSSGVTDVRIYDPDTGIWSTGTPMPEFLSGSAAIAVEDLERIYIIGGLNSSSEAVTTVYIYHTDTDTWSFGPSLPVPRWGPAGCLITPDKLFITGGRDENFNNVSTSYELPLWKQVTENGFGDPTNAGSDIIVFNSQMYAFTSNTTNWRSSNGIDWSEISLPFTTFSRPLIVYNNYLYVSTRTASMDKEIWRSSDGTTWEKVFSNNLGNLVGGSIKCAGEFNGYIYVGSDDSTTTYGLQIWRSLNGNLGTWVQVFDDPNDNNYAEWILTFNSAMYVGVYNHNTGCRVYKSTDGTSFVQVSSDGFGNPSHNDGLPAAAIYNNELYVGTYTYADGCQVWKNSGDDNWVQVNTNAFGVLKNDVENTTTRVCNLIVFNGGLIAATHGAIDFGQNYIPFIFKYEGGTSWSLINEPGFGQNDCGTPSSPKSTAVFNGDLYVAVNYWDIGTGIWRY